MQPEQNLRFLHGTATAMEWQQFSQDGSDWLGSPPEDPKLYMLGDMFFGLDGVQEKKNEKYQ